MRVAGPVEGSTASVVLLVYVNVKSFENVQRWSLVALSSHMKHVKPELVRYVTVSPLLNQGFNSVDVAFKRCEVQRSESITLCAGINPVVLNFVSVRDILFINSRVEEVDQYIYLSWYAFQNCMVKQVESFIVFYFYNFA
jgi:hypothetical protein